MVKILFSLLFVLYSYVSYSQNWVEIVDNERQVIEVDFSSIKRGDINVLFWNKTIYKKDIQYYIDKQIESLKRNGIIEKKDKWKNWSYTLTYQEFNCNEDFMKIITVVHYNKDDSIIARVDFPENKREKYSIVPNSLMHGAFFVLCNKFKYQVNGKKYALPIEELDQFLEQFPNAQPVE